VRWMLATVTLDCSSMASGYSGWAARIEKAARSLLPASSAATRSRCSSVIQGKPATRTAAILGHSDRVFRMVRDTRTREISGLDGALLAPAALWLIGLGAAANILFTAVYTIEGATRPGYNAWSTAISALSLGPRGWVQQANFIVLGVLTLCAALGWRQALRPGPGASAYPVIKVIEGVGLLMTGIFSTDEGPGYPITTHGQLHNIFSIVTITAVAVNCFVLARRFAWEPRWRWWAPYAAVTGLLTMVFIALYGALGANGGLTGVHERLSPGVASLLGLLGAVKKQSPVLLTSSGRRVVGVR